MGDVYLDKPKRVCDNHGMENFNVLTLAERIPDEAAAYKFLEELRWDDKPVCPHCGSINDHYFLNPQGEGRKTRTGKVSARRVWKCKDCRKQFSVPIPFLSYP